MNDVRKEPQQILVFQQNGSGENKIRGIKTIGNGKFAVKNMTIGVSLPAVIDDASEFLPGNIEADLVLDYLKHPDLSYDLAEICKNRQIPEIATRKKINNNWTYSPPICCALSRHDNLGEYGRLFGAPEFEVEIVNDIVSHISILRGAPCGATWEVADKILGMSTDRALQRIGLETQFFCTADPADWDPLYGTSPVHLAAEFHTRALINALR